MEDRKQDDFVYKWTKDLTEQLIVWRGANKNLFTGRRNAARMGFAMFIKEMGLEGKASVTHVKRKWENLKQKYTRLKNPSTGSSAEGEMTAATWRWFKAMDEAMTSRPSIANEAASSSSATDGTVLSSPSEKKAAASSSCYSSIATSNPITLSLPQCAPIVVQDVKVFEPGRVLKWTDELTEQLISWRTANKNLFTGRRHAARMGFAAFIKEMGLEGKVSVAPVKKRWEYLKQKYMDIKNAPTGRSAEGEMTAPAWKWFRAMDEAVAPYPSITNEAASSSSAPDGTVLSSPSEEKAAASSSSYSSIATSNPITLSLQQCAPIVVQDVKVIETGCVLKWTDEFIEQLILWRVANKSLFTGKPNAAQKGFQAFIKEMGLEGKVSVASVKKKWENLKQKYKEIKNTPTGMTAPAWKWFRSMEEAVESSPSNAHKAAGSSSASDGTVFSIPAEETAAASSSSYSSTTTSSSCYSTIATFSPTTLFLPQCAPIAVQLVKVIEPECVLKWTDELTEQLILWRAANKSVFTGRPNAAQTGFQMFIKEMGLEGKVSVIYVKKKWENLKQKYKELKNPPSGRCAETETNADNWKWFSAMEQAVESSYSTSSPAVGSSIAADGTVFSSPSEETAAASTSSYNSTTPSSSCYTSVAASSSCYSTVAVSTPCLASTAASGSTAPETPPSSPAAKRAKKEPEWLLAIKELERREEARDARQAEWERAMMEREKRRDQEMREREVRRDQEMREREERRDREMREREERLIAENREREDRQAKEAADREERFLALMDFLVKK